MEESLSQLKQLIDGIHPIPADDWQEFSSLWQPFSAKRKEILTTAGQPEKYLYFVLEGVHVEPVVLKRSQLF